jgi:hypothetical protein
MSLLCPGCLLRSIIYAKVVFISASEEELPSARDMYLSIYRFAATVSLRVNERIACAVYRLGQSG